MNYDTAHVMHVDARISNSIKSRWIKRNWLCWVKSKPRLITDSERRLQVSPAGIILLGRDAKSKPDSLDTYSSRVSPATSDICRVYGLSEVW